MYITITKISMTSTSNTSKNERLQLRLTTQQKEIIARAAQTKQTSMSNFILEESYQAALEILSSQTLFSLTDEQWENFCQALEAPPKPIPALKKLLTEKSVFEDE